MKQDLYRLHQNLSIEISGLRKHSPELIVIPDYVSNNLKYRLFDWQREALEHFLYYLRDCRQEPRDNFEPTHLLFNMATGSGKTLVMAACILYLYKNGYRHFIFTVNYNNIVDKTQNNFINTRHSKYLFKNPIIIDGRQVIIKEVNSFSSNPECIEIKFTSIQLLHNEIHIERENTNTLADLNSKKIVILADEAHNLNAQTKTKVNQAKLLKSTFDLETELANRSSSRDIERKGWEHTLINLILKRNDRQQSNENICLEFTATVPDTNPAVLKKYSDKLIYRFDLKDFLRQGYTKEIILISSGLSKTQRVLLGLIFNWYRHQIALKYAIANFKPIILFRSKDIESSKIDHQEFIDLIRNLKPSDFNFLLNIRDKINEAKNPALFEMSRTKAEQVIKYVFQDKDNLHHLIIFLKDNFKENNIIITNSKSNKTKSEKTDLQQDALLNSLEDPSNHIRAIFTVRRLTEGWDVLNLFDIVRLFETRDEGKDIKTGSRKIGQSTIEERQLIGRGVRYYPFKYSDYNIKQRKFDGDLGHDLRILEEFCFHSVGSRYISELKNALIEQGYINPHKIKQRFELKSSFKQNPLYHKSKIAFNEREENINHKFEILEKLRSSQYNITRVLDSNELSVVKLPSDNPEKFMEEKLTGKPATFSTKCHLKDYLKNDKHIFLKAINQLAQKPDSIYNFLNLKHKFNIKSVDDLLLDEFIGNFTIYIKKSPVLEFQDIDNSVKFNLALAALQHIAQLVAEVYSPQRGSEFKLAPLKDKRFKEFTKEKMIESNKLQSIKEDWYVLDHFVGTDQEEDFLNFMRGKIHALKNKYREVFLIRNEEVYKIYDFDKGRGFQPDFLLFLMKDTQKCCYQIFIEPKGGQYKDGSGESYRGGKEGWKQAFLEKIKTKYEDKGIVDKDEDIEYKIIGLPFYNSESRQANKFEAEFNKILL